MAERKVGILIEAKDRATGTLRDVTSKMEGVSKSFEKQIDASKKLALGVAAAGTAIGGFGVMALRAAGDMEQTRVAFETMLGSAEKADVFIRDLVNFAKTTPFELRGLETASKQLLAYGFQQEEILPNLKALGDIASGVGMDKLPNLILAFGQVKAATRLTGMELRQFTEAGVPLLDELAKQFGKPVSAIQEMVSAGEVGFPAVQEALQNLTGEGGRFNDLMDKQAKTFGGLISNLQDAWDIFLREQGAKILEWAKKLTEAAIYFIQNVLPQWVTKINELTEYLKEHQAVLYAVAGAILGALAPAIGSAIVAFASLAVTLAPFMITGAIIGGIVAGIVWLVQNWDMLKEKVADVWNSITEKISGSVDAIGSKIKGWLSALGSAWETTFNFLKDVAINTLAFMVGGIVLLLDAFIPNWKVYLQAIGDAFVEAWNWIKDTTVEIFNGVVSFMSETLQSLVQVASPFLTAFSEFWGAIWSGVKETFVGIWNSIKDFFGSIIDWIAEKVDKAVSLIEKLLRPLREAAELTGGIFSSIGSNISAGFTSVLETGRGVLGLAEGGIVTKPTLAVVGEGSEPEAVIPLSKLRGAGGITINVNGGNYLDRDAARMFGDELASILRLNMRT